MTTLQTDIIEIYNALVVFSESTIKSNFPKPIKVRYDSTSRSLIFEQAGRVVNLLKAYYYSMDLEELEKTPTYLLPKDYDYLMYNLRAIIMSGRLLEDRTCLSPENFGFDIFAVNPKEAWKGPDIIGNIRFISGTSWLFRFRTKRKYRL